MSRTSDPLATGETHKKILPSILLPRGGVDQNDSADCSDVGIVVGALLLLASAGGCSGSESGLYSINLAPAPTAHGTRSRLCHQMVRRKNGRCP